MISTVERVYINFGGHVSGVSSFRRFVKPKVKSFTRNENARLPFVFAFSYPKQSGFAVPVRFLGVLQVFCISTFSKVFDSVIGAVSINVVNEICRPNSVNVKPCKPVCSVVNAANHYKNVSGMIRSSGNTSLSCVDGLMPNPSKGAVQAIIGKFAFKFCGGNSRINLNHAVAPVKQWFGRVPLVATNYFRHPLIVSEVV